MRASATVFAVLTAGLFATPAHADWVGQLRMTAIGEEAPVMHGKILLAPDKMRVDYAKPAPMSTIVDHEAGRMWMLIHPARMIMEIDLREAARASGDASGQVSQVPACKRGADFDKCIRAQGFRKVGREKVNGRDTVHYARREGKGAKAQEQHAWYTPDRTPALVRMRALENGRGVQMDVTDLEEKELPDSAFVPPKGYRKAPKGLPRPGR